ncbi:hypothetical protein F7R01_02985 [Pseudomonas argentinensis]|nr:hypothetical protein F7R01_02985 [Pseudomonas argentinensis]
MIRCAHPSGQPAAVTSLRCVALACPRESNQREGYPTIRARRPRPAAPGLPRSITTPGARCEVPSLPRRPRPSQLSRHPCRSWLPARPLTWRFHSAS